MMSKIRSIANDLLNNNKKITWFYVITGIFVITNSLLTAFEIYYLNLVPVFVLLLIAAFVSVDKLLYFIVFFTPLSLALKEFYPDLGFNVQLPTEPFIAGVMFLFFLKMLIEQNFDKKILRHPVTIAIIINLSWLLITSLTSTLLIVSIKFLISRLWYVIAFYFIGTQIFINKNKIKTFSWLYIVPFLIVIIYTITRLWMYGLLNQQAANWVMTPFYKDHTSYGALLAMFIPVLVGFASFSNYSKNFKAIVWLLIGIFLFALVLSYTRAAWLSILGALMVLVVVLMKIKFRTIVILALIAFAIAFQYREQLFINLEKNKQDASADFKEHIKSISNVASDASNLERINRWKSALRMFQEKPVLGWGPGTYMFKYAPFQFSYEKTIISTNAGNMGNAHSEYIGPLAESGVLGTLTFLAIIITTIYTGIRVFRRAKEKELKMFAMVFLLGLITYYLHGFLNNFLDTDKASVPFWGFTAILVALDVYHSPEKQIEIKK